MSSRRLCLQAWRLRRLRSIQTALRPIDDRPQCLAQLIKVWPLCQRQFSSKRDTDFTIREFVRKSPEDDEEVEIEPDVETKVEAELLREEVEQLKKEIEKLQAGPFSQDSDFMQSLPPDVREKALKALEKHGFAIKTRLDLEDDITDQDFESALDEEASDMDSLLSGATTRNAAIPAVNLSLPAKTRAYVTQFNQLLQRVVEKEDETSQSALWKSYLRCRAQVSGFTEMVSDEVWDALWTSQLQSPERVKHQIILAEDALESGHLLTAQQWLTYLSCLNATGDFAGALEKWIEVREVLDAEPEVRAESLDLGVRLQAANGELEEALQMATVHAATWPRLLVPVIIGFAQRKTSESASKAWALYLRLKTLLGSQMKMSDYEHLSTSLLTAGEPDMALAIFKDMLLSGDAASSNDSLSLFKKAQGYIEDVQATNVSEEDVNRVSLAALTILPQSFQNKYFYSSWIKKLIGLREIEAAASVVELMYERGVKPDARHLNGIIGAWMRESDEELQKRARAMAWSMIEKRLDLVEQREAQSLDRRAARLAQIAVIRPIPAATIETFAILLQHYLRSGQGAKAKNLMEYLKMAALQPQAIILNQWIFSCLRQGRVDQAWKMYTEYREDGVRPNLGTFARLFDCGKVQYERYRNITTPGFPRARALFAEMNTWLAGLQSYELHAAKEEFSRELYDQIVRCFCLSHDLRGTLCALHGMKQTFHMYPDADTIRLVLLSVGRHLGADDADGSGMGQANSAQTGRRMTRRRRGQNPNISLARVSSLLDAVANRKAMKSEEQGIDPESIDMQRKAELQLEILTEFLVIVLARNVPETISNTRDDVHQHLLRVAESMGVGQVEILWEELESEVPMSQHI